jgi:hypothetical protein
MPRGGALPVAAGLAARLVALAVYCRGQRIIDDAGVLHYPNGQRVVDGFGKEHYPNGARLTNDYGAASHLDLFDQPADLSTDC